MNHINQMQKKHLSEIIRIISMYQVLSFKQLLGTFPELGVNKLQTILKQLQKSGRIIFEQDTGLVFCSKDCSFNASTFAAYWILLDFISDITYHTISEFPVSLTFYTYTDCYDVIHVPEEKEILINHALSTYDTEAPKRLVVVDNTEQISHLHFPGIAAFCMVDSDGKVRYFKKQGVTDI